MKFLPLFFALLPLAFSQGTTIDYRTRLRNKPLISVMDAPYRAIGNGVVDDTDSFQAAINAGSNNTVIVPAGNYYCGSALTWGTTTNIQVILQNGASMTNCALPTANGTHWVIYEQGPWAFPIASLTGFGAAGNFIRSTGSTYADSRIQTADLPVNGTFTGTVSGQNLQSTGIPFATLTGLTPNPGTIYWCSDCAIATTCTGSSSGAWAFWVAVPTSPHWSCPF